MGVGMIVQNSSSQHYSAGHPLAKSFSNTPFSYAELSRMCMCGLQHQKRQLHGLRHHHMQVVVHPAHNLTYLPYHSVFRNVSLPFPDTPVNNWVLIPNQTAF